MLAFVCELAPTPPQARCITLLPLLCFLKGVWAFSINGVMQCYSPQGGVGWALTLSRCKYIVSKCDKKCLR